MAAGSVALQVLSVVGACVFYGVELVRGEGADRTQVVMSIVTFLVGAACLGVLAAGLWRGRPWARTPTIVWSVLLLPVAWSLVQSDRPAVAAGVALLAATGLVGSLALPPLRA